MSSTGIFPPQSAPQQKKPDPLNKNTILAVLRHILLETGNKLKTENNMDPILIRHQSDLIVAILHSTMANLGFRLTNPNEPSISTTTTTSSATTSPTSTSLPPEPLKAAVLPIEWNSSSDIYSLQYKHSQSQFTFEIKILKMGNKLIIHGMSIEVCVLTKYSNQLNMGSTCFLFSFISRYLFFPINPLFFSYLCFAPIINFF